MELHLFYHLGFYSSTGSKSSFPTPQSGQHQSSGISSKAVHSKDAKWWSNNINSRSIESWMGNSFELVCMKHHAQIKEALGIRGMSTEVSTWQVLPNEADNTEGAQIDMIIERADRIIHLCEMKFSQDVYHITKDYDKHIRERGGLFKYIIGTKKTVVNTFITTFGVANGKYRSIVHSDVTMDDLFES